MNMLGRPRLSDALKADLWVRWKGGQFQSEMARVLGMYPVAIFAML